MVSEGWFNVTLSSEGGARDSVFALKARGAASA